MTDEEELRQRLASLSKNLMRPGDLGAQVLVVDDDFGTSVIQTTRRGAPYETYVSLAAAALVETATSVDTPADEFWRDVVEEYNYRIEQRRDDDG